MKAGELRHRFRFEQRTVVNDTYGTREGAWHPKFTVWARLKLMRGGEDVLAARLKGVKPGVLTVRSSTDTREITTAWRAVNVRTGETYNIRSVEPDATNRDFIEMLVQSGVADG